MSNPNPYGAAPGLGANLPQQSTAPQTQAAPTADPCRIVIGPVVLSYPSLFTPKAKGMGKLKPGETAELQYSAEFYVYQSNPRAGQIIQLMQTAVNTAAANKWNQRIPNFSHQPVRNLAEKKDYTGEPGLFLRTKSTQKPVCIKGPDQQPADTEDMYAGAIVYASVTAYPYSFDNGMNNGIGWFLNNVWKCAEGPRLASRVDITEEFASVAGQIEFNMAPPQGGPAMPPMHPMQTMPAGYPQMPAPGYPPQAPPFAAPGYPQMPPTGYPPQAPPPGYPPQMPGWPAHPGQAPLPY